MMSNKNINVPNELILMILENVLLVTQKITIKRLFLPIKKQRNFGTLKDVFFPYLLMKIKLSKGGF